MGTYNLTFLKSRKIYKNICLIFYDNYLQVLQIIEMLLVFGIYRYVSKNITNIKMVNQDLQN